jgi:hypothetical protein
VPLVSSDLVDSLQKLFEDLANAPADTDAAGKQWAQAYGSYAGQATGLGTPVVPAGAQAATQLLGNQLGSAFNAPCANVIGCGFGRLICEWARSPGSRPVAWCRSA